MMTPDTFATQSLRPRDQLDVWREWYSPVLDVLPTHLTGDEFRAEIRMWKLGGLAMSRTAAPPVNVVRAKRNLRRDPVDHWVISYCARGAHFAQTARRETEVPEGSVPLVIGAGILA
jgi:hypothetical protein